MTYTIKSKEILKNLSFTFFLLVFGLICFYYNFLNSTVFDIRIIIVIIGILVMLTVLLLLDYLKNSTKGTIKIGDSEIEVIHSNGSTLIYRKNIISVTLYGAPSVNRKSDFRLLPFEAFHYVEVKCLNHPNILITSLSDYRLYENIAKEKIFKGFLEFNKGGLTGRGSIINSIWWNKLK